MAEQNNQPGKQSGSDTGTGGKVSAGTSVGNIGEAPMPHAREGASGSTASGTQASSSTGGGQHAAQGGQEGSMTDKAQQTAEQVRRKAGEAYEGAADWAENTYERVSDWASDTYEQQRRRMRNMGGVSPRNLGQMRSNVQDYVSENPMVVGLVGLAAGLLLGALLPRTRRENQAFGEWADEVRHQGMRYAREAAQRGREYVEEALSGDEEARFGRNESESRGQRPEASRH